MLEHLLRSIMKKHIIITASLGKLKLPLALINKEKALLPIDELLGGGGNRYIIVYL